FRSVGTLYSHRRNTHSWKLRRIAPLSAGYCSELAIKALSTSRATHTSETTASSDATLSLPLSREPAPTTCIQAELGASNIADVGPATDGGNTSDTGENPP